MPSRKAPLQLRTAAEAVIDPLGQQQCFMAHVSSINSILIQSLPMSFLLDQRPGCILSNSCSSAGWAQEKHHIRLLDPTRDFLGASGTSQALLVATIGCTWILGQAPSNVADSFGTATPSAEALSCPDRRELITQIEASHPWNTRPNGHLW